MGGFWCLGCGGVVFFFFFFFGGGGVFVKGPQLRGHKPLSATYTATKAGQPGGPEKSDRAAGGGLDSLSGGGEERKNREKRWCWYLK